MLRIRYDELENKHVVGAFLSILELEGVLQTTFETHDGRTDKVWFYDSSIQTKTEEERD